MYGKIFDSMYEGTLYGHWQAIVTLQQMLVLCNQDGVIDMTPQAIAARTSIPMEIITAGIKTLSDPDPHSRTPGEDGRRIVLLDDHRPWGWRLVNYAKYQQIRNRTEKLDADRIRIADKRKANKTNDVAECRKESHPVADVAPVTVTASVSASTKVKSEVGPGPDPSSPGRNGHDHDMARELRRLALQALNFLNEKTRRNYEPVPANVDPIVARLKQGSTLDDIRAVIAKKCREWSGDERMAPYLRPKTLFNATNFANYKGELEPAGGQQ